MVKLILEFLDREYSGTNLKNWFNYVLNLTLAMVVAFFMAVLIPLFFYQRDILLEMEYPTKLDYDDIKLLEEDEHGRRQFLIQDEIEEHDKDVKL